jgi:hypothetical protein
MYGFVLPAFSASALIFFEKFPPARRVCLHPTRISFPIWWAKFLNSLQFSFPRR